MKAWQFNGIGQPLQLVELPVPVPQAGQLVVAVKAVGMCHSDVGYVQGHIPLPRLPFVLGHEVAGVVSAVGPGVEGFAIGDRVAVGGDPMDPTSITPGVYTDGGYAEYVLGDAKWTLHIPDSVPFEQAAPAADAGSTSYGAVMTAGRLQAGQRVGIIGLGGLGMTGAKVAALKGAEVHAAEPRRELWDRARSNGVHDLVDDADELANRGLDLVVDFAGFDGTTGAALRALRPFGRVVQIGLGAPDITISKGDLLGRQAELVGFLGGRKDDVAAVLDLMTEADLQIHVERITFDQIPATLERLTQGKVAGRAVALIP